MEMIKRGTLFFDLNEQMWFINYFYEDYEITGPPNVMGNYSKKIDSKSIPVADQSLCVTFDKKMVRKCKFKIVGDGTGELVKIYEPIIQLSPTDAELFFESIDKYIKPNGKLIEAAQTYKNEFPLRGHLECVDGKWFINDKINIPIPLHPSDNEFVINNLGKPGYYKEGDYLLYECVTIANGTDEFDVMDMDVAKITEDHQKWLVKSLPENKNLDWGVVKHLVIEAVNRFAIMDEYNQPSELKISEWLNRNYPKNHVLKSELVYLASPYSHPDDNVREMNYKIISKIASEMVSEGKVVMSPISYGHNLLNYTDMPSDWDFWYNFCVTFLLRCDRLVVCMMPGWDKSRGVAEEIEIAIANNIPVEYIKPKYDEL